MVRLYKRLFKSLYFLLFILLLVQLYYRRFTTGNNLHTPIDQWLITNHSITMLVNNAFLLFQMKKLGIFKSTRNNVLLRIGKEEFYYQLYKISIINLFIYFLGTYGILTLTNMHSLSIIPLYAFFLMINLILFFAYESLFNFMVINQTSSIFICIPFILNIVFHYAVVPLLFFQS